MSALCRNRTICWTNFFPLCLLALIFVANSLCSREVLAAPRESPVSVYLFWVKGCPHCSREIHFLQQLQQEQPDLDVHYLEITQENDNRRIFLEVVHRLGLSEPRVPLTIVGNQVWMGYGDEISSDSQLKERIAECRRSVCPDLVRRVLTVAATQPESKAVKAGVPERMRVPWLGEVTLRDLSLPALTVLLGALDGFNPCAMWTLVFLIGLLLGMKDRVRMWVLGSAFIVGSAAVYFVFMAAWLNLLLFLGALLAVRVAIGLVALGGGFYSMRQYFTRADEVCAVTAPERRRLVFQQLKTLAQEGRFLVALGGILVLAFLVNLVELLCSAGIPAVYTQILAMHALPTWQYYAYLLLYILVFMADDLLVFVLAMVTLQVSGLTGAYSRYSHLIGGVLLLAIGAVMLLRPDLLMFG